MTQRKTFDDCFVQLSELRYKVAVIRRDLMRIDDRDKNLYSLYEMLYSVNKRLERWKLAI